MSRQYPRARTGEDRTSLYDEITNKIISELEAGRVPWVQPWGTAAAKAPLALPKSAASGRQYSGINILILWGAATEHGFTRQSWLTFRQALSLGGHVRKGERGTTVVYADRFVPVDEKRRAHETGEEAQAIPLLKRFTVFNSDQCDGLLPEIAITALPPPPGLIEPQFEYLIKATGIDFRIGGNRAFYAPSEDYVQVPPPQAYSNRSIGIERPCMNWRMPAAIRHVSTAICRAATEPGVMPLRSWLRKSRLRSVARRSVSCPRCGTPTISARGLKSCVRTIAQLSGPLPRPARSPIISLASSQNLLSP